MECVTLGPRLMTPWRFPSRSNHGEEGCNRVRALPVAADLAPLVEGGHPIATRTKAAVCDVVPGVVIGNCIQERIARAQADIGIGHDDRAVTSIGKESQGRLVADIAADVAEAPPTFPRRGAEISTGSLDAGGTKGARR